MRRGRGAVFGFVEEVEGVVDIVCCSMDVVIVIVVRHFFSIDVAVRATFSHASRHFETSTS
jgi:hypothetical protein